MKPRLPRLTIVFCAGLAWVAVLGLRLYYLQVVEHARYVHKARQQQQRVVRLDPPRGTIYDAAGRELAVSVQVDSAFAVPSEIDERSPLTAHDVSREVAAVVPGVEAARLENQLSAGRDFVWVARKLDPPVAAALRRRHLPGVHFVAESKRYYPMRELAAQVLGYVGLDNVGLAGLEKTYDAVITGKPGIRTVLRDARRGTVESPDLLVAEPQPGGDLYLTLDAAVQHMVERELQRVVEERRARRGSAVFLDPSSGAVLAMASFPTFDPNEFDRYPPESQRNRSIMDAYEPGSTFKVFTAAAALESGLVHADDPFDCGMGSIVLYGVTIRDHKPYGILPFADVIAKSSNVGVIRAALIIGSDRLYRTTQAFGFGRPTGIDLPGESAGILHPLERWGALTKAYVAFGQGISVTPLQLAAGVAAVANGGTLLQPYIVDTVRRGEAAERRHLRPHVVDQAVSPATAAEVRTLMERVVTSGTGKTAAVAGYRVAGKTGTAQISSAGGYAHHIYLPSFVGFAPADRPMLVGVVAVDSPQGFEYYGGQVAAPVFASLVRQVLLYRGVRPERPVPALWPGEMGRVRMPAGVVPAVAAAPPAAGAASAAGAEDDDAAGEDVPEMWHGRPAPAPALVAAAPAAAAAGSAGSAGSTGGVRGAAGRAVLQPPGPAVPRPPVVPLGAANPSARGRAAIVVKPHTPAPAGATAAGTAGTVAAPGISGGAGAAGAPAGAGASAGGAGRGGARDAAL